MAPPRYTGIFRRFKFPGSGIILRVALSVAMISYLLATVPWSHFFEAIVDVGLNGWLLALTIYTVSQTLSGIRWAGLARPLGFDLSVGRFVKIYFEGMFFGLCLPSSIGGDFFKAYRMGNGLKVRLLGACTVLADRVTGLAVLMVIALSALLQQVCELNLLETLTVGAGLMVASLLALGQLVRLLSWGTSRWTFGRRVQEMAAQLKPYRDHPRIVVQATAWSLLIQALSILTVVCLGRAMSLTVPMRVYCLAVPAVALATALPLSIAGLGIREGGLGWFLTAHGVSPGAAVALGLAWSLVTIACGLIGGVVYMAGSRSGGPGEPDNLSRPPEDDSRVLEGQHA